MIKCTNCGYDNSDGGLFCSNCGQKLEIRCSCGATLPTGSKFCSQCGSSLTGAAPKGDGGNVIAGDVTGSYNTTYHTTNSVVNNVYNQVIEEDAFCSICHQKIPASAKSVFLCQVCGKHFCASHMDVSGHICNACSSQQANAKFDRYKAELKMQMYDGALSYFKSEMAKTTADPDVFYYAAIATLRGRSAFMLPRDTIEEAENYIEQAIQFKPKGIYYYFLAYIKYDFYERKYFRTSPNYKEAFSMAIARGVTQSQVNEMYSLMRVSRPSCL